MKWPKDFYKYFLASFSQIYSNFVNFTYFLHFFNHYYYSNLILNLNFISNFNLYLLFNHFFTFILTYFFLTTMVPINFHNSSVKNLSQLIEKAKKNSPNFNSSLFHLFFLIFNSFFPHYQFFIPIYLFDFLKLTQYL